MATAVPVSVPVVLSPACSSDASSTSTSTAGTNHVTSKKTSAHSPHNNMVTSKAACSLGTTSRSMKANSSSSIGSSSRSAPQTDSGTANATSTSEKGATGSHVSHGFSDNCWTKTKTSHKSNDGSSERESEVSSKEFKLGTTTTNSPSSSNTSTNSTANTNKPSAKTALDALAILASSAHHQLSSNNHNQNQKDDSEIMPPPPPRIKGRLRSASNPEGMEKWDSYSYFRSNPSSNSYDSSQSSSSALTSSLWSAYSGWNDDSSHSYSARRHFVLPSCILEEELAEANETCKIHAEQKQMEQMTHFMDSSSSDTTTHTQGQYGTAPIGYNPVTANAYASANSNSSSRNALQFQPSLKRGMTVFNIEQFVVDPSKKHSLNDNNRNNNVDVDMNLDVYGTSPTTVISPIETNDASKTTNANNTTTSSVQGTKKKKKKKKKPRGGGNGEVATVSKQQEKGSDKNQSYHNNEKKISFMNGEGVGQEENDVMAPLEDEAELDPAELLRRARNKLFEDLSCSENCGMEKGVVPLPHSLDKYKEVSCRSNFNGQAESSVNNILENCGMIYDISCLIVCLLFLLQYFI